MGRARGTWSPMGYREYDEYDGRHYPPKQDTSEAARIQAEIQAAEEALRQKRQKLAELGKKCLDGCHNWGETIYDPKITPGYQDPGDPPGTMGVDWRGPMYIPEQREDRWYRKCSKCGYKQYTSQAEEVKQKVPKF